MTSLELLQANLLSPMVLAFVLGVIAVLSKSDLKIPEPIYAYLSIYLLLAIGLKGGAALSTTPFHLFWRSGVITLGLGLILPPLIYMLAHGPLKFSKVDSAALSAHYASVSVVTFIAAKVFCERAGHAAEGFMTALVAILEVPGIVVALLIGDMVRQKESSLSLLTRLKTILFGKSVLLLWGGLLIGYLSGPIGLEKIGPFFVDPFQGVLVLFLLDMGIVAGAHLPSLRRASWPLITIGLLFPLVGGGIGSCAGYLVGLSTGGCTVLGAMVASASYIAAPAAVRISLPTANPAYYLTAALAITFPFNLCFGIPLYHRFALWIAGYCGG